MSDVIFYTLGTIARILTKATRTKIFTEDRIWQFVKEEGLKAERVPDSMRGAGKRPYWIRETDLIDFLKLKGYDTEEMFDVHNGRSFHYLISPKLCQI